MFVSLYISAVNINILQLKKTCYKSLNIMTLVCCYYSVALNWVSLGVLGGGDSWGLEEVAVAYPCEYAARYSFWPMGAGLPPYWCSLRKPASEVMVVVHRSLARRWRMWAWTWKSLMI